MQENLDGLALGSEDIKCRDTFIHGHSPCLHAEVRCGTQAWPSAAGVNQPDNHAFASHSWRNL